VDWAQARTRLDGPIFTPLRSAFARLPTDRWPSHAELTALAAGATTSRGMPLSFVAPRAQAEPERRHYELRIADTGQVETRPGNWHDLFNALVWITFPRAKAALNAQHAAILEERGEAEARHRSPERDALTLFDEGGVVVLSSDPSLSALIPAFEWKALFWNRRAELEEKMRFLVFGHACYEQALQPYKGMVAKTVILGMGDEGRGTGEGRLLLQADAMLARFFADRANFRSPKALAPMPVLGVPGWHEDTNQESFYDDARHFRSKPG